MTKLRKYCLIMGIQVLMASLASSLFAQLSSDTDSSSLPIARWDQVLRTDSQTKFSVPFYFTSQEESEEFHFSWTPEKEVEDSLYLTLQGVAWAVDVYMNGRFLASFQHPLELRCVPISPTWLSEGENHWILNIHQRGYFPNYPKPFTGILHPIELYEQRPPGHVVHRLSTSQKSDSIWVWAPYFRESGFKYVDSVAIRDLVPILNSSVKSVYFPFPPPPELLHLLENWGLTRVDSLKTPVYLAMLNPFPYAEMYLSLPPRFWLDSQGKRSSNYGQFIKWEGPNIKSEALIPGLGLVAILLFPIFSLLIVKFANPHFYYSLQRMFSQPNKYIDSLQETTTRNSGFSLILMLINILSYSILVFLLVYFIQRSQAWEGLSFIRENSLLKQVFYPTQFTANLFLRSLLVVVLAFVLKYLLLRTIASVFSIRNLTTGTINLDIICNFPYTLILTVPLVFLLVNPALRDFSGILFLLLGFVFFARKIYIYFFSLERIFGFSLGVKILYICAFNILPYIIWF